jgi:hypothetical protein
MATPLGSTLPPVLRARLGDDRRATPEDVAVSLTTIDGEGFPHPALLSYGEIRADGDDRLRIAVHAGSRTAGHLGPGGRATLAFVDESGAWYVKAEVTGGPDPHDRAPGVVVVPLRVVQVLADATDPAREPDATLVSGIRFQRAARGTTL